VRAVQRLLLLAALLAAAASTAGAAPQRAEHDCVRGGELFFRAADGTRLVGHRFGKGTTAVILTHQSEGDLCDWLPYAKRLASKGYFAFPIDFRGYGFSDVPAAGPYRYTQDIAAAAKALRTLGKKKIFVVGASMGGLAAVVAGANVSPPLAGVVSVSSPARYRGMDGVKAGPRLRVPLLYLAATADDNAGYDFSENADTLHRAAASKDKRLELLPGAAHGIELVASSTKAKTLIEGFLKGH
jgi:pimeloyl-ACP methyl ester carboxylesterase